MLDINLFRDPHTAQLVRDSQTKRYADVALVDAVIQLDDQWRNTREELNNASKNKNALNKDIGAFMKKKEAPPQEMLDAKKDAEHAIAQLVEKEKELGAKRDAALGKIGNLVPDSVPVSDDESNNLVVDKWGDFARDEWMLSHYDLVQMAGLANTERGSLVAGSRGYFLTGLGVMLNQALISYAMRFLSSRKFTLVQTPFVMNRSLMGKVAQLDDFDEQLYKVTGAGEDQYLIATSEQPLCAFHKDTHYEKSQLPRKYVGYSTCFRKEAGSHGRDQLGIFRVHQFEKVEQFVVTSCEGNDSWDAMEEMIANSKEFYRSLKIPFNVVNIVSGELNDAAAKKYDLEAWFPGSNATRELVSCSNCTDYQSRRLEVRFGAQKTEDGKKRYVHMLNSTLIATERAMCCVVENYQTPTGIKVPDVLREYMGGVDFIPFVNPPPKPAKKGGPQRVQRVPTPDELAGYTTVPQPPGTALAGAPAAAAAAAPALADDEAPDDAEGRAELQSYMDKLLPELNAALNTIARDRPAQPLDALAKLLADAGAAAVPAAAAAPVAATPRAAEPASAPAPESKTPKKEEPPPSADTMLDVEGMSSQADADALQAALAAVEGVMSAAVELNAKKAKIVGSPGFPTEAKLVEVCEEKGFKATPKKLAGGLFKFDPAEVDVNGGDATADDLMEAFGF